MLAYIKKLINDKCKHLFCFLLAYIKKNDYLCNIKIKEQQKPTPKSRKGTENMKTTTNNTYSIYNEVMRIKASKRDWNVIILVKNGDIFESYEEDANQISDFFGVGQYKRKGCLLNIAGFHKDFLPFYLPRLLRAGRKVTILDK